MSDTSRSQQPNQNPMLANVLIPAAVFAGLFGTALAIAGYLRKGFYWTSFAIAGGVAAIGSVVAFLIVPSTPPPPPPRHPEDRTSGSSLEMPKPVTIDFDERKKQFISLLDSYVRSDKRAQLHELLNDDPRLCADDAIMATALTFAVQKSERWPLIEQILKYRKDLAGKYVVSTSTTSGSHQLNLLEALPSTDGIEFLLDGFPELLPEGKVAAGRPNPLHSALEHGYLPEARVLLERYPHLGREPHSPDFALYPDVTQPLHIVLNNAFSVETVDLMELLLSKDPHLALQRDSNGRTAFNLIETNETQSLKEASASPQYAQIKQHLLQLLNAAGAQAQQDSIMQSVPNLHIPIQAAPADHRSGALHLQLPRLARNPTSHRR